MVEMAPGQQTASAEARSGWMWLWGARLRIAAAVVAALCLLRPLAYGASPRDAVFFWGFVVFYVVVPGVLTCRALGLYGHDWPLLLGMGSVVGLALETFVYVGTKVLGIPWLFALYPLAPLAIGLWLWRREAVAPGPPPVPPGPLLGALLVCALAVQIQPLFSDRLLEQPLPDDLLFHAGNAAELRHHWPPRDPRIGGRPLNYHFFAYALAAGASERTGRPVCEVLSALAPLLMVFLLVLQLYNAGRVVTGDGLAGVLAAALVVFHTDPAVELGAPAAGFLSYLGSAVYGSPSTVAGFIYLVSLMIALHRWWAPDGAQPGARAGVLGALALAASGAKGSVMPVVLLALAAVAGYRLLVQRQVDTRGVRALLIVGVCSMPMTVLLSAGEESFRDMFRLLPGWTVRGSGSFQATCAALASHGVIPAESGCGDPPVWFSLAGTLAWLVGYLGLGGLAGLVWLARRSRPLGDTELWAIALLIVGLVPAYLLFSPTLSQLFFVYNGQVVLAVFGGAALASVHRISSRRRNAVLLVLLPWAALPAWRALRGVVEGLRADWSAAHRSATAPAAQYREGLDWLRLNAATNAVVIADHSAMLVSSFAERRGFYETGSFTARAYRLGWSGISEAYPERLEARGRFFRTPEALAGEGATGPEGEAECYLLVDNIRIETTPGWTHVSIDALGPRGRVYPEPLATLDYANEALRVYRVHLEEVKAGTERAPPNSIMQRFPRRHHLEGILDLGPVHVTLDDHAAHRGRKDEDHPAVPGLLVAGQRVEDGCLGQVRDAWPWAEVVHGGGDRVEGRLNEQAPAPGDPGRCDHPPAHGLAVGEPPVARDRLEGVAEGVAEVEHPPQAALALVPFHHFGLHPASVGQRAFDVHPAPAPQAGGRAPEAREERAIGQDSAFQDLVGPAPDLAQGEAVQEERVDDHRPRLVEGADQVLRSGVVDADLAADRAVHHGQQGRGHGDPVDPPHVGRGREAGHVPHDPAPQGDHETVAPEPGLHEGLVERVQGRPVLEALPVGHEGVPDRAERGQGARDPRAVEREHAPARDQHHPPAAQEPEDIGQEAGEAMTDGDRVTPLAQLDRDLDHSGQRLARP